MKAIANKFVTETGRATLMSSVDATAAWNGGWRCKVA